MKLTAPEGGVGRDRPDVSSRTSSVSQSPAAERKGRGKCSAPATNANDPVLIHDPADRAVKMAMAMREAAGDLIGAWRRRGRELGFGAGIAHGYATLGQIGLTERSGYTAIGTVRNVAARPCAEAKDGQILLSQRVAVAVEGTTTLEELGALTLKGLTLPVVTYNVPLATCQPALRVIEADPRSV